MTSNTHPDNIQATSICNHQIQSDGKFLWIPLVTGQIQIKFEGEGVTVDLHNAADETVSSTAATYSELSVEKESPVSEAEEFWGLLCSGYAADIDGTWCRHLAQSDDALEELDDNVVVFEVDEDDLLVNITAEDVRGARKTSGAWRVGEYDFTFYSVEEVR